jgi:HK97 family phage prohead protease
MTREIKFLSLGEFKAIDEGPGGFRAYATVFRELDDVGDIILPGAYKNTIPQFLKRGFIAKGHDWNTRIGIPRKAGEDDTGFWIEASYHQTAAAQEERTITNERKSAGMEVPVSIGYEVASAPIFVNPQDYQSELPKYVREDLLSETLVKAQRFPQVRVLPEVHLFEVSLVAVPALQSATVTTSKAGPLAGQTLEEHSHSVLAAVTEYAAREADLSALRTKEGRPISEARRQRIAAVLDALDGLDDIKTELRKLLDETAPPPKTETDELEKALAALQREHYARQPRLRALRTSTRS